LIKVSTRKIRLLNYERIDYLNEGMLLCQMVTLLYFDLRQESMRKP